MAYRLSNTAAQEVIDIYVFGARHFGIAQAEKYHAGLERIFGFLAATPPAARERREFSPPVRIHPFGAHVVVYLSDESGVLILRVLGGSQDWADYL